MIVADTSVIYALLDADETNHEIAADWYLNDVPLLATTPLILAEVDHLAATRAGSAAQQAFHADVANEAYAVEWCPAQLPTASRSPAGSPTWGSGWRMRHSSPSPPGSKPAASPRSISATSRRCGPWPGRTCSGYSPRHLKSAAIYGGVPKAH